MTTTQLLVITGFTTLAAVCQQIIYWLEEKNDE